jgi:hypothetical protein
MLAVVGLLVQEVFHPLLGTSDIGPAVTHFDQVNEAYPDTYFLVLFALSLFEVQSISTGWDPIEETLSNPKIAGMRDDYVAGSLSFDPLGFMPGACV